MDTWRTGVRSRPRSVEDAARPGVSVVVSPAFVTRTLVPVIVLATVVSLLINLLTVQGVVARGTAEPFLRWLGVDREESLPTLFQVLLVATCAASLWTVATYERAADNRRAAWWTVLSVVFAGLAVDESLQLHEMLTEPIREALDLGGFLEFAWIVAVVPVVVAFALLLIPFLRSLPRRTARRFVAAGALYLTGAVVFEMLGGAEVDRVDSLATVTYVVLSTAEELFEMLGLATFLAAVGEHFRTHTPGAAQAP